MKFFHLSDLHIGLSLLNQDFREDQAYIFHQMIEKMRPEAPDAVVIAGDIYDRADPSAEAVELFNEFMAELTRALPEAEIMVVSGNHDSASRVDLYRDLLSSRKVHMIGQPPREEDEFIEKVTLSDAYGPVNFYLLPFVRPFTVRQVLGTDEEGHTLSYDETLRALLAREEINTQERNVLVSHQFYLPAGGDASEVERADSERIQVGNIDQVYADVLSGFDYAALGHIHRPMQVGDLPAYYCGTPLAYSVSETGQEKRMLMVQMGEKTKESGCQMQVTSLPLSPLRQVRKIKGPLTEVLASPSDDYVSVTLTEKEDIGTPDLLPKLRKAFPHLLEQTWDIPHTTGGTLDGSGAGEMDPYALCLDFAPELNEEEKGILQDVIKSVWEVDDR